MTHTTPSRVVATEAAAQLIDTLMRVYGPLIFFQPEDCTEGGSPMCYPAGEFSIGQTDVCLGVLHGSAFYVGRDDAEYWLHTQLIVDVIDGAGSMFSLENGTGKRFFTRARPFSDEECERLARQAARECVRQ
ncbi:DUF779 domain-containing protein [Noviherbaspirillum autotrophicum]|uniref:Acetaldehyde dehydrogenase n=1 Tax=Noviherbaspirillum autotrophicum TaxID=709839 RepID=A0A0C1Y883_9BURK|nr:DUF779 domain-containing protein [Noviherbaspirillum autotrophicum]KIF83118.1 acetaldehyde dehydrogenase [Noviherbaspirillum autotrophicum]